MIELFKQIRGPFRSVCRLRWFLAAGGIVIIVAAGLALVALGALPDVAVLKDRRSTLTIEVRDWQGREHPFRLGPQNPDWTPLEAFPAEMKWAVILAEDGNFYEHQGVDVTALREALKYDLEKKRLARGASTITQQLAKNVFLSRDKSVARKLSEIVLALRMERELTKGRILELYLNVVELGPMVYGAGQGARYYFHKPPGALTPAECASLAAILPGPRVAYNPELKPEKVRRRTLRILHLMELRKVLSKAEYDEAVEQVPALFEPPAETPSSISEEPPAGGVETSSETDPQTLPAPAPDVPARAGEPPLPVPVPPPSGPPPAAI